MPNSDESESRDITEKYCGEDFTLGTEVLGSTPMDFYRNLCGPYVSAIRVGSCVTQIRVGAKHLIGVLIFMTLSSQ